MYKMCRRVRKRIRALSKGDRVLQFEEYRLFMCVYTCVYIQKGSSARISWQPSRKGHPTPDRDNSCVQHLGRWGQCQTCRCLCPEWVTETADGWKVIHLKGHPNQDARCFSSNSFEQMSTGLQPYPSIPAQCQPLQL